MNTEEIKKMAYDMGADLCGLAPIERFANAPKGFNPQDIYGKTESILIFAKRLPTTVLFAESCIPYTHVNTLATAEVDRISLSLSLKLEDNGIPNVLIPSNDPIESWNEEEKHGQAILSLRHAAFYAGLGKLGKNNLLINDKFGNMLQFGAILLSQRFEYNEMADYEACPASCSICLRSCPVNALDGSTVNQKLCRPLSNYKTEKGYILKKCWECRKSCPNAKGILHEKKR
jgi:epoxyqueuosine reductase QueG